MGSRSVTYLPSQYTRIILPRNCLVLQAIASGTLSEVIQCSHLSKAKRWYLLIFKVIRYCLLALHGFAVSNNFVLLIDETFCKQDVLPVKCIQM